MRLIAALTLLLVPSAAYAQVSAGAARIDITPPREELVAPFTSVADPIFVRALAIESSGKQAIIVIADVPTIAADVRAEMTAGIAKATGVPSALIVVGTTHTHNAMRVAHNAVGIIIPGSSKFVARVSAATLRAVTEARRRMVPARFGVGKGRVALTGNRNVWSVVHNRYISDVDRIGAEPVDHTLGVVEFETMDGKPIALLLNHGFEPVVAMAMKSEISGDVPGVAARMIEERLGNEAVALFTIGAAGVPLYRAEDTPEPRRRAHATALMQAMGTVFSEEALAVAAATTAKDATIEIDGAQQALVCPGKATTPFNLPDRCAYTAASRLPTCTFADRDADPSKLDLSVVRLGPVALVTTDANVAPALAAKLQRMTPIANTWVVAMTFGPMRFVVDDAAYPQRTYEATATTARAGCAESKYLDSSLDLLRARR
jgi:neutral ceramidase